MAANKTVIVLAPNGRRQFVKITLDTTILQILEEVCQKQGYNADDYDIKHIHQILNPNTIFRFTGLPNNAQLEMVACTKARSISNVTIGIQSEDGQRKMHEFSSNATLAQALIEIYPNSDLEKAVLIYMHREVYGKEVLEKTTLKSLGINCGKAILRLIYRNPEQSKTQAHVSTPLLPKILAVADNTQDNQIHEKVPSPIAHCSKTMPESNLLTKNLSKLKYEEKSEDQSRIETVETEIMTVKNKEEEETIPIIEDHLILSRHIDHDNEENQKIIEIYTKMKEDTYKTEFLGERNALVFNQAGSEALPRCELPDDFFELNLQDARIIIRDAKHRREQLENAPLQTEAQRQLDREKRTLDQLNKYQYAIIRIHFPDHFILQALFRPLEKIQTIKNFIQDYLDDPNCEFLLYTTPPKHILNPDIRLIDENLVPSAIIHYSGESLLKSTIKNKSIDPKIAHIEAIKSRTTMMRKNQDSITTENTSTTVENTSSNIAIAGSSEDELSIEKQNKMPKWFKQTFK